ncbi:c2h2 type zinc finger domain containing protein [Niveomyces insectorum RCEF 264]|uniref:C2h2 type zinc finger domain containing protein n=1 Tax=Niveomyces insectorum RCEF 264 TaxID=1081102 RepID=A0A167PHC4_9HYPO|nr:c2h2 type zinc finger domain containing protein [Niveomyces insectorum RCEF 264]
MKRSREPEDSLPAQSTPSLPSSPSAVLTPSTGTTSDSRPPPLFRPAATTHRTTTTTHADDEPGQPRAKIVDLDPDQSDAEGAAEPAMTCFLHRDKMEFPSYDAYETHYNKEHLNRCLECRRNFPSPRYLSLHGDEWHDPFVAAKRDKGEHTYACFVEGCERKCASADKRKRHLMDKHSYPKHFFFSITQYGIDGRHSLLNDGGRWQHYRRRSSTSNNNSNNHAAKNDGRRRAASTTNTGGTALPPSPSAPKSTQSDRRRSNHKAEEMADAMKDDERAGTESDDESDDDGSDEGTVDSENKAPNVEMDDLAGALSAMSFVPRSVRFGRGRKVGFLRRQH